MLLRCLLATLLATADAQSKACGTDPNAPFCTPDETCCKDSPGCTGVCTECCLNQVSECVEPRQGFTTSTCCPKWTVGCSAGSVGCCDPARPWQMPTAAANEQSLEVRQPNRLRNGGNKVGASEIVEVDDSDSDMAIDSGNGTAYALFTKALLSGLVAFTIDIGTGKATKRPVTGPFASYMQLYYGEGTRILPWDPKSKRFLLADSNLNGGKGNASTPIVLYTINPSDGSSTAMPLKGGCTGYPIGQAWDVPLGKLVVATQSATEVAYFSVDVDTAEATSLGTLARGSSEASAAYYGGYLSHSYGGVAIRVGHKRVSTGESLGVSEVALKAGGAGETVDAAPSAKWSDLELKSHGLPASVHMHDFPPSSNDDAKAPGKGYVALAPSTSADGYDIIGFQAPVGVQEITFAKLSNAHAPQVPLLKYNLSYVAASLAGNKYGAMTVARHPSIIPGTGDKWKLSTVDLSNVHNVSGTLIEVEIKPQPAPLEGAETVSLSGFGIAA